MKNESYLKFGLMMASSFVFMYAAMFFNVAQFDHIMLSYTRTYMTFLMIAPMAVIMLLFIWPMYKNKVINYSILIGAIVIFTLCFVLLRTQTPIKDVQYMKAMIPHHSSAIMVSEQATLEDPETKKLAEEIIEAQKREIAQMEKIIHRLEHRE
jgi:peptidoglycan/LPS O-acetylase OafA/YrhL